MKRTLSAIMVTLLILTTLTWSFNVQPVEASGTIYIKADGSIVPSANITTADNVTYYFTDNNYDEIVVERSNIIIDGNGYTLQGPGSGAPDRYKGFFLVPSTSNVTIRNTNIKNFTFGFYVDQSSFNSISGNNIHNNTRFGVYLDSSSFNNVSGNDMKCFLYSIWIVRSSNNSVSGNNILIAPVYSRMMH